jgi:hypothetical protein
MALDSKNGWSNSRQVDKDHINLVNPANKRNIDIIVLLQVLQVALQLQLS